MIIISMLYRKPADHETLLEFSAPTELAIETKVAVVGHERRDDTWQRLGIICLGQVAHPPTLLTEPDQLETHINILPDEPYPAGDLYASRHPVWLRRVPYRAADGTVDTFCYTVEPLEA